MVRLASVCRWRSQRRGIRGLLTSSCPCWTRKGWRCRESKLWAHSGPRRTRADFDPSRKALNKLGVSGAPKPVHLLRQPKIPPSLATWSLALDMNDLEPALTRLASCVEHGFGLSEIAEVIGTVEMVKPEEARAFRFPVTAGGASTDLWLDVFLDDVDSPDLAVYSSPAVVEAFRSSMAEASDDR